MRTSSLWLLIGLGAMLVAVAGCGNKNSDAGERATTAAALPDKPSAAAAGIGELSERLYTAANEGNRQLAFAWIERLSDAVRSTGTQTRALPAGWKALEGSIAEARTAIQNGSPKAEWYRQASRIKLASDQLINPGAPLWLQYEEVLADDWDRMRKAWASQTADPAAAALLQLKAYSDHADRIEVAALMQRPEEQVKELRLRIDYTGKMLNAAKSGADHRTVEAAFNSLREAANRLFGRAPAEAAMERLPKVAIDISGREPVGEQLAVLFISAFVMGVLAFAGWRIYAYEKRRGMPVPPAKSGRPR